MRLWVDDVRPAPNEEYMVAKSVNIAKHFIESSESLVKEFGEDFIVDFSCNLIDIDHDAGEYVNDGGDYIKLLNWLEETGRSYPIRLHSQNPVGIANMRRIIERNGWKEIK